jgi:predicted CXXCH cytochrome family protein
MGSRDQEVVVVIGFAENKMRQILCLAMIASAGLSLANETADKEKADKLVNTPHNITHWSDSPSADSENENRLMCRVCHGPRVHEEATPLWDRNLPRGRFVSSGQINEEIPGFPADSTSRMCLVCHDGALANGFPAAENCNTKTPEVQPFMKNRSGPSQINTHLFNWAESSSGCQDLRRPDKNSGILMLDGERLKCSSCHDAHDNSNGNFLRMDNSSGELCLECHNLEHWSFAVHSGTDESEYNDMKGMACNMCHNIHATPAQPDLLTNDQSSLCFSCHDSFVDCDGEIPAEKDLKKEFEKLFTHPVNVWSVDNNKNNAGPGFAGLATGGLGERTVGCSDCHNVHASRSEESLDQLPGSLFGASGVNRLGRFVKYADFEYEVCMKCHGFTSAAIPGQRDISEDFSLSNRSFHPVFGVGNSSDVPSLKNGWSAMDQMNCSDCHGNDNPEGPAGPHGSDIPGLLKLPFNDAEFASGEPNENGLCFECHTDSFIQGSSGWGKHRLHLDAGYSCAACHDPHGSSDLPGLLRLDKPWIEPVDGELTINSSGLTVGTCTLMCHGHVHKNSSY